MHLVVAVVVVVVVKYLMKYLVVIYQLRLNYHLGLIAGQGLKAVNGKTIKRKNIKSNQVILIK